MNFLQQRIQRKMLKNVLFMFHISERKYFDMKNVNKNSFKNYYFSRYFKNVHQNNKIKKEIQKSF